VLVRRFDGNLTNRIIGCKLTALLLVVSAKTTKSYRYLLRRNIPVFSIETHPVDKEIQKERRGRQMSTEKKDKQLHLLLEKGVNSFG